MISPADSKRELESKGLDISQLGILGWRGYAKLQFVIWAIPASIYFWIETHQDYPKEWFQDLLNTFFWAGTGILLTIGLCFLYERIGLANKKRERIVAIVTPVIIASATVWFVLFSSLEEVIGFSSDRAPFYEMSLKEIFHSIFPRVVMLSLWHLVGFVRVQSGLARMERERSHRLEKLSLEAQIRQLRGSLNPHFLFNSLNSAITLVDENPENAKEMMLSLSTLLRETLASSSAKNTTLSHELQLIRKYVEIERVRYEEDLLYEEDIADAPDSFSLPPFLLLPLVENAIKHGMRTSELPLRISVQISYKSESLIVKITNTGNLEGAYKGEDGFGDTHIGVRSVKERLALELPDRATFTLEEEDGVVVATMVIGKEA